MSNFDKTAVRPSVEQKSDEFYYQHSDTRKVIAMLYNDYYDPLEKAFRSRLKDELAQHTEDLVQTTFMRLLHYANTLPSSQAALYNYISLTASNVLRAFLIEERKCGWNVMDELSDDNANSHNFNSYNDQVYKFFIDSLHYENGERFEKHELDIKKSDLLHEQAKSFVIETDDNSPESVIERENKIVKAHYVISTLPRNYREILELYFNRHDNLAEVAEHLGISHGTARQRYSRAIKQIRHVYG